MDDPWCRAASFRSGRCLFLSGHDHDVVPLRSGCVQHQERESTVAGDQSETHVGTGRNALLIRDEPLDPPGGPAQDDPSLGAADELHEVAHLRGGQRWIALDLDERT